MPWPTAIERKGLGLYLIQKGAAIEKRKAIKVVPRIKAELERPLSKELVKLNYKVQRMEADGYEEDKVPETDEEEDKYFAVAWKEFLEAVAQGTTPEILKAKR